MKNLFGSALRCKGNYFVANRPFYRAFHNAVLFLGSIVIIGLLLTGCKKESIGSPASEIQNENYHAQNHDEHTEGNVLNSYTGMSWQTIWELLQARAATAKYRDIRKAISDGYADISVVVPNMGHHYMKSSIVDATFEFRKPEILVYNKKENGDFQLVAVEYAVPINLSPDRAPKGFTGSADVWDRNTGFGLWLLHAWVWSYNPSGVFNPTNPLVHTH